jgi:hypothetical protein
MKYRPKHRWPATVHNGRADKEDWQSYTIDHKTENSSEKPNNCEDLQDWKDRMCAEAIVTEPTISKMEQVGTTEDCSTVKERSGE